MGEDASPVFPHVVSPRGAAQQVYREQVQRRVDPALLEKAAANRVSARVFPILPRERKQIIVSYSQPLIGGDGSYRLPLQGLPELDELPSSYRQEVAALREHPAGQFALRMYREPRPATAAAATAA